MHKSQIKLNKKKTGAPTVPPVKKGYIYKIYFNSSHSIVFNIYIICYIIFILIFLEKSGSQGKKRSLESDNDDTKSSSPPRVSTTT